MGTNAAIIPLFAEAYQPEVNAILTELVDGYQADTIETLEGISATLASVNGAFNHHILPPVLDLQILALRMSLAKEKIYKYLRAKQALDCLGAA